MTVQCAVYVCKKINYSEYFVFLFLEIILCPLFKKLVTITKKKITDDNKQVIQI